MSEYKYFIQKIFQPSPDMVIIEAGDKRGLPVFSYKPGQYAMISYKNSRGQIEDKHAFSIASSPSEKNFIRFGIKIQGAFTQGLVNLKVDDELLVSGPYGKFIYNENKYSDLVLIAGGIGITPFYSALNYFSDKALKNKLALIYSARTAQGATFYQEIKNIKNKNPNISVLFSFTEDRAVSQKEKDVINKRIDASIIKDLIGNIYGKSYFICGPVPFMEAMTNNLLSLGVSKNQIKTEEFNMIPDQTFWPRLKNFSYAFSLAAVLFIIAFSLINKPVLAATKKTYNSAQIQELNLAAYNRMISIYDAKNKAIAALNSQIIAAGQAGGQTISTLKTLPGNQASGNQNSGPAISANPALSPTPVSQPSISAPLVSAPIITPTPVYTPTQVTPAPIYTPAPTPTTRVS